MVVFRRKTSLVAAKVQIKNYINLNGENFELQSKYFSFGHEFGYEKKTPLIDLSGTLLRQE